MAKGKLLAMLMGGPAASAAPAPRGRTDSADAFDDAETDDDALGPDSEMGEGDEGSDAGDEAAERAMAALDEGDAPGFRRAICEMLDAEGY